MNRAPRAIEPSTTSARPNPRAVAASASVPAPLLLLPRTRPPELEGYRGKLSPPELRSVGPSRLMVDESVFVGSIVSVALELELMRPLVEVGM